MKPAACASPLTSEGGHDLCVDHRFVRNRTGNPPSLQRLRDDVNGDMERKGWEGGENRRVEREGRGVPL